MTLLILLLIIIGVAGLTWFFAKRKSHPVIRPGAPSHDGAKEPVPLMVVPPPSPAEAGFGGQSPPAREGGPPPLPQQSFPPRPPFTTPL